MTNATDPRPTNYTEAADLLGSRDALKIGHNTTLQRLDADTLGVLFHGTYIVRFGRNGSTRLYSGGYRTVTTKERINRYLPQWASVYQSKGEWKILRGDNGPVHDFEEGCLVQAVASDGVSQ